MNLTKNPNPVFFLCGWGVGGGGGDGVGGGGGGGEEINTRGTIFYIEDTLSQPLLPNRLVS